MIKPHLIIGGEEQYPFYMIPAPEGTYRTMRGQNHIRGATLSWIDELLDAPGCVDFQKIVKVFRGRKETIIEQNGQY